MYVMPYSDAERLEQRSIPEPNSGCLLWTGPLYSGYGRMVPKGAPRADFAHRIAYRVHVGPIPKGMCVCHRCDTRACINPRHLFVGTQADNVRDAVAKQRNARGERSRRSSLTEADVIAMRAAYASDRTITLGALARRYGIAPTNVRRIVVGDTWAHAGGPRSARGGGCSKLTDDEVALMRQLYRGGSVTQPALAKRFGVSPAHVWNVLHGRSRARRKAPSQ